MVGFKSLLVVDMHYFLRISLKYLQWLMRLVTNIFGDERLEKVRMEEKMCTKKCKIDEENKLVFVSSCKKSTV